MKLRANVNMKLRELIDIYITNTPTETAIFNERADEEDTAEPENTSTEAVSEPESTSTEAVPETVSESEAVSEPENTSTITESEPSNSNVKEPQSPNSDDSSFVDKMLNAPTTADELIAALERKKKKKADKKLTNKNTVPDVHNNSEVKEENSDLSASNETEMVKKDEDVLNELDNSSTNDDVQSLNTATEKEVSDAVASMSDTEKEEILKIADKPQMLIDKFEDCENLEQAKELLLRLKGVHGDLHPRNLIGGITLTSYIYCVERLADTTDNLTYDFTTPIQKESREYINNFKVKMFELIHNVIKTHNIYYDAMEYMVNVVNGDIK